MRVIIIAIILMITSCSCRSGVSADNFLSIQKKLFELKSYKCTAEIKIISNKNTMKYTVEQYYMHPGKYRLEIASPEALKGLITISNGKDVSIINPYINTNNLYYSDSITNFSSNNTLVTEFFASYVKSEKSQMTIEDKKYKLSTEISSGNVYLENEALVINSEGKPEKLEIFDPKGNLKTVINYKEFVINPRLDLDIFELQR